MRQSIAAVRRSIQPFLAWCTARWHRLSHYWQHFVVAIVLGIGIELGIHAAHDFAAVKRVQNAVLDTTLKVFSMRDKPDPPAARMPVLLVEDDLAVQSPAWGQGQTMTLEQALALVGHAYDRGATHVLLDVTFDRAPAAQAADAALLADFARRHGQPGPRGPRHLYVARSTLADPCLPRQEALETLRPAAWDQLPSLDLQARPGLVIHSVLPHYRADADQVVRGWDLFGVLRAGAEPAWQFLPSPQLAYASARQSASADWPKLPWLGNPSKESRSPGRAEFAAQRVQAVPLLEAKGFAHELCVHHPQVLGCPVPPSTAGHTAPAGNAVALLEHVNQLLRPLPAEQQCRARATELLASGLLPEGHDHQPHDLLFNRIVFELPSWERAQSLAQRGYYIRTPLTIREPDELDWSGRLVAIGSAHAASGDWHATPVGRVPGVLINLNAMLSLERVGPVSSPPAHLSLLVNALIIVMVAAIFSALSPLAAAGVSAVILLGSLMVFHQYLLSRGIWIEFGAPLLGINMHRIIDGYLAKRRLEASAGRAAATHH